MMFSQCTHRGISTSAFNRTIQNVVVFGSGTMGHGIAQVAAMAGNTVGLVDLKEDMLKNARDLIEDSLQRIGKKRLKSKAELDLYVNNTMSNITFSTDPKDVIGNADLVVEAIIETVAPKQKLFEQLDKIAPEKTIFTSNSSSISIKEISTNTKRKDRCGGLHFCSPVVMMKLLEVARTEDTSQDTYVKMRDWGELIGKTTVTCKDNPGLIFNRLWIPLTLAAARMVDRGEASVEDIETAMKVGARHAQGPLATEDGIGLDVLLLITEELHRSYPGPLFDPPKSLVQKVKEGKLGVKNGEGWFKYKKKCKVN